ncbi:MAG TPA: peptidylprolyl isomerase [Armatimonadota bacterium]|jgi:cyclophilin family peptidyl-prolyl cis-trans isomerase
MANRKATIATEKGDISVELAEDKAPITAGNFIGLAEKGFYNGLNFHRVEPGFVIQGGCPQGTGMGGSGKNIPLEIHPELRHGEGALAMARSANPDSASSQFYITLAPTPFLDDNYAVFGHVLSGMDVVKSIRKGDKITSITVEQL